MSIFRLNIPREEKPVVQHPWARIIKNEFSHRLKYAHNSIRNPVYPKKSVYHKDREQLLDPNRVKFTIIGDRITKEFINCRDLVKGLHKYRFLFFDAPIIRGVTTVEWPMVLEDLKERYGGLAYCLESSVAVLMNDEFFGGEKELKNFISSKYVYHVWPNYYRESVGEFARFIRASGRPCVYMHISIDKKQVGTLIFMLFSDVCPYTSENFMRLCKETRGGYGGTPVHRIVKDGWIQCGGFGLKSTELQCENFIIPHDRRGVLGMANDGRHIDCSTQFFVLLQPMPWMAHKYVAFGQLIDGVETLKKIENVETFYESPKQEIIISKAGIFNMECDDIMINKNAHEYILSHIEDLFALGELLYEELLEKVFLEAQMRELERLRQLDGEGAEEEEQPEGNIRTTQRFNRKKEEIEKQLEKSRADEPENNEFDVESYNYDPGEAEEYSYKHSTITVQSLIVKPEKKFYIPLTDVPYPGEVSSEFDLKRFLQGNYCLESDLRPNKPEDDADGVIRYDPTSFPSEVFDVDDSDYDSPRSMNSDEEKEIKKYLKQHGGSVSYAGGMVRTMARDGKLNIFENARKSELITDDELRRLRLQSIDMKHRESHVKKVSISLPEGGDVHHQIKRRQTGFVRPADLERIYEISGRRDSEIGEEEQKDDDDDDDNDDDDNDDDDRKVRIAPAFSSDRVGGRPSNRRPTGFIRPSKQDLAEEEESEAEVGRPSVLERLYSTTPNEGFGPTLKDYKPLSEQKQNNILLTISPTHHFEDSSTERFVRHSMTQDGRDSLEHVLNLQHGKKVARKISSDYVKTIDHIEQKKPENSIRSVEFAKTRPAMSVAEYQEKNKKYYEELKKTAADQLNKTAEQLKVVLQPKSDFDGKISGIRLPGDTPTYMSMEDLH